MYSRFPTDPARRDRWGIRLRRLDVSSRQLCSVICSEHFHPSDFFYQWGRKLVKPDAEPTIFSHATPVMRRKPLFERCSEPVCKGKSSAAMDCEQSADNLIPQQADISTSAAIVSAQPTASRTFPRDSIIRILTPIFKRLRRHHLMTFECIVWVKKGVTCIFTTRLSNVDQF